MEKKEKNNERNTNSGGGGLGGALLTIGVAAAVGIGSYFFAKKMDETYSKPSSEKQTNQEEYKSQNQQNGNSDNPYERERQENLKNKANKQNTNQNSILSNNDSNMQSLNQSSATTVDDLESFLCPISQQIMIEPVMTIYGHCFEKKVIIDWIQRKGTCPLTNQKLTVNDIFPAFALKSAIDEYRKKHQM
eukprot:403377379